MDMRKGDMKTEEKKKERNSESDRKRLNMNKKSMYGKKEERNPERDRKKERKKH